MSISCPHLRDIIIIPALTAIGLNSDSAVNLLLGTAAQETQMGRYLVQTNLPPYKGGIGIYQMEAPTYDYIWTRHVDGSNSMKAKLRLFLGFDGKPPSARIASDLSLASIMARLKYADVLERLPEANDIPGMARYWKIYWNTMKGDGTPEKFIANYKEYVT